jgi:hypothetical protein
LRVFGTKLCPHLWTHKLLSHYGLNPVCNIANGGGRGFEPGVTRSFGVLSTHLRTLNPGLNTGFPPFYITIVRGDPRVKPGVWRPEIWALWDVGTEVTTVKGKLFRENPLLYRYFEYPNFLLTRNDLPTYNDWKNLNKSSLVFFLFIVFLHGFVIILHFQYILSLFLLCTLGKARIAFKKMFFVLFFLTEGEKFSPVISCSCRDTVS